MWKFDHDRIRILRESKGLELNNFSTDFTSQQVKQWESGVVTPSLKTLLFLCNMHGVVPGYFFEYRRNSETNDSKL